MSYGCCSGRFSSRSFGGQLHYPYSSCGSSYPCHLIYSTNFCSPRTCHVGSSLRSGCHQNCFQPIRCQTSHVVQSSCQRPSYSSRVSSLCSPCRTTYAGSQGFGSGSCHSLGYGSRSSYSLSCGSSGFRPHGFSSLGYGSRSFYTSGCGLSGFRPVRCGVRRYPSFGYGSGFCQPSCVTSRNFSSSCKRLTCGSAI